MDTFYRQKLCFLHKGNRFGKISDGETTNRAKSEEKVYASGMPIGIYIKTEGILVLGLQQIDGKNSPASCKIKAGDYILKLNAQNITTKQQFIRLLQKMEKKKWC